MNKLSKIIISAFIVLSNLCAFLLWMTKEVALRSQSMYFDQPNVAYYVGMHVFIILTFFFIGALRNISWYILVGFASIATLMFDLGSFVILHDISTALLFGLAVYSIVRFCDKKYRNLFILLCSIGGIFFLAGIINLLGTSGIFLGEVIAEISLSACVLIDVWNRRNI